MPLIAKQIKPNNDSLQLRVEKELIDELEAYCSFIDSDKSYVVSQALMAVFSKDKSLRRGGRTIPRLELNIPSYRIEHAKQSQQSQPEKAPQARLPKPQAERRTNSEDTD